MIELILGALLLLGLFTRPVAFILAGEMAFAYFIGHVGRKRSFYPLINGGTLAIMFCFACLYLRPPAADRTASTPCCGRSRKRTAVRAPSLRSEWRTVAN